MKNYLLTLFCICLIFAILSGCADNNNIADERSALATQPENNEGSSYAADERTSVGKESEGSGLFAGESAVASESVDMNLTVLSRDLVHEVVSEMMLDAPDAFLGKRILIEGIYYSAHDEITDQYCHYLLIDDEDACCGEELELIWSGELAFPDDYPEENSTIEVVGVFSSYERSGYTFYYLAIDGTP